jgi:hypothetical protein
MCISIHVDASVFYLIIYFYVLISSGSRSISLLFEIKIEYLICEFPLGIRKTQRVNYHLTMHVGSCILLCNGAVAYATIVDSAFWSEVNVFLTLNNNLLYLRSSLMSMKV